MRHGKKFNHLKRTSSHRKALLRNMATSLIMHKRITTTLAKAKELRKYVEPLVTRSKEDTMHSRRMVFSYLQDKYATQELFDRISERVGERPGGYTRIIKLPNRQGDNAEIALIELVDYNANLLEKESSKSGSSRRRRRKSKSTTTAETAATTAEAEVVDTTEEPAADTEAEDTSSEETKA